MNSKNINAMKTITNSANRLMYSLLSVSLIANITVMVAQDDVLLPDQNPNYKVSMDKYIQQKDELTKTAGLTIQNTYKAIDDVALKIEKKAARRAARNERRLARIENRNRYYSNRYYSNYSNSYQPYYTRPYSYSNQRYSPNYNYYGYNNYGHNNYGYNNGYNNAYRRYSYSYYRPACAVNTVASAALLGLGLYWWLN
jgi:hypothetical protein